LGAGEVTIDSGDGIQNDSLSFQPVPRRESQPALQLFISRAGHEIPSSPSAVPSVVLIRWSNTMRRSAASFAPGCDTLLSAAVYELTQQNVLTTDPVDNPFAAHR
jgi:hypothetical protein